MITLKIAIVVAYYCPTVCSIEFLLAKAFTDLGCRVRIIASSAKAPREYIHKRHHPDLPFEIMYATTIANILENPITPFASKYITPDFDAVLLQNEYSIITHLAYLKAKKLGIPIILTTEREVYPWSPTKRWPLRLLDRTINKKVLLGAEVIVARSSGTKNFLKRLGIPETKIIVLSLGADCELFQPLKSFNRPQLFAAHPGSVILLTVARLHPYKGLKYLIKAMKIVIKKHPEVILFIWGRGPQERELKQMIKSFGLERNVFIVSTVIPNQEMVYVYNSCDIYVQPSIVEPFGLSAAEAMACGKPVVGTAVGVMADVVTPYETGFLVQPGDIDGLGQKIIELVENQSLRLECGRRARTVAVNVIDSMAIGKKYLELIRSLQST